MRKKARYTSIFTLKNPGYKILTILTVMIVILLSSVFSSIHKIQHSEIPLNKEANYVSLFKGGLENSGAGLFSSYYYKILKEEIALAEDISGEKCYRLINRTFTVEKNADADTLLPIVPEVIEPTATLEPVERSAVPEGTEYVVNKNTGKFHYPHCSSVDSMKESNKWLYVGTREELVGKGYDPCGRCHP